MGIYRCNVPNGDEVAKFGHVQNKAQINAFLYMKPKPRHSFKTLGVDSATKIMVYH